MADLEGKVTASNRALAELWQIPQSVIDAGDHEAVLDHVADRVADPDEFRRREDRDHRARTGRSPPTTSSS